MCFAPRLAPARAVAAGAMAAASLLGLVHTRPLTLAAAITAALYAAIALWLTLRRRAFASTAA
jgi:hypothetical protein